MPSGMSAALRLCAATAVLLGSACHHQVGASAGQPAARAVDAYLRALRADDPRRAYDMLSAQTRQTTSFEAFSLMWRNHKLEREQQAAALAEGLASDADLGERAKVIFTDGRTVALSRQGGAWRLDSGLISRTHAATPHAAIEIFADGMAAHSFDDVMRVLTARRKDGIGRQVDLFVTSLKKHLADAKHKINFVGKDRAELAWDEGDQHYKIVLRLEGDEWRIDDVHLSTAPHDDDDDDDAAASQPSD
jgi:hypothetical protein